MDYSILMSVYYKENADFLKTAIESMLKQSVKSNDFVIVCDGELTDELYAVLDYFESDSKNCIKRVQLEKNYGLGIALNKGLSKCKNELVARMDSDDIAVQNRIERQLEEFKMDKELVICGSYIDEFVKNVNDINAIKKVPIENNQIKEYIKKRNPFNHMTVMFKKKYIMKCGSYKDCYLNEDYYLWARLIADDYRAINIPEVLVHMRAGDGMYERRGGIKYISGEIMMQKKLYRLNLINLPNMLFNIIARSSVRLLPNSLRKRIYIKYLRRPKWEV